MNKNVQRGFRAPEDEPLFTQQTEERGITPDSMTAGVEGYFRNPAIWVGEEPDSNAQLSLDNAILQAVVFTTTLSSGIEVRVLRNGTFLFDFSSWPLAPQIQIPGFRIADPKAPFRYPEETTNAEDRAEEFAIMRAVVMNIHQVCMLSIWWDTRHSSTQIGNPVTASAALKHLSFSYQRPHDMDIEHIAKHRMVWEIEIIERSLELLDQILSCEDRPLMQMVEAMYFATYRYSENRLGEALILAWAVCEQLVHLVWKKFIRGPKLDDKRKQKLKNEDYTVSTIMELLEMNGEIAHELYLHLEAARSARNSWVHKMRMPRISDVRKAFRSTEKLLLQVKKVSLSLTSHGPWRRSPYMERLDLGKRSKEAKGCGHSTRPSRRTSREPHTERTRPHQTKPGGEPTRTHPVPVLAKRNPVLIREGPDRADVPTHKRRTRP